MPFNIVAIGEEPLLLNLFEKYTRVAAQTASKYLPKPLKKKNKLFMAFIIFRCCFPVHVAEWEMWS